MSPTTDFTMNDSNQPATTHQGQITPHDPDLLAQVGAKANEVAQQNAVASYLERKAHNTIRAHGACLHRFADFLAAVGAQLGAPDLHTGIAAFANQVTAWAKPDQELTAPDPTVWRGVTWGIVQGFRDWMIGESYSVSMTNLSLSAVKTYAKLAMKAGVLSESEQRLIASVTGYSRKDAKRVNERRDTTRRPDAKKAEHTRLTVKQADKLKQHPNTPQGRRDALLMCLLLDHGLRASEIEVLHVTDFDLTAGTMTFYRPKVDMTQTHELSQDTLAALRAWFNYGDAPAAGPLLRGSRRGGKLTSAGMSTRSITKRVRTLAADLLDLDAPLSAHDCRHFWATFWAGRVEKLKRGVFTLQEAGGWASLVMPRRYVEAATIANEGMT